MWVLDTNTLIYFFKGEGRVAERLLEKTPQDIGVPSIVLYELYVGIAKSSLPDKRSEQLSEFLPVVQILPFHYREALAAAEIRANLESIGQPIGPCDTLIAGTASAHGAVLVSRNVREFSRVEQLRVENWY